LFLETCGGKQGFELFDPVLILHPQRMKFSSYAFFVGQHMVTGRPVITFCQQKRSGPSTFTRALISLHVLFFISEVWRPLSETCERDLRLTRHVSLPRPAPVA
jgi:hypothetical protein